MADQPKATLPADDPFFFPREERQRLFRRDIREAAKVYRMHGVKMVGAGPDGVIREVDPQEVIDKVDALDGPPAPRKAG